MTTLEKQYFLNILLKEKIVSLMFLQGNIDLNIPFESKWPGSQFMFFQSDETTKP